MVTIIFEAHSTSLDNESGASSGWFDARLSPAGMDQSKQLGERYAAQRPDVIFTSDLKRAYQTATIAFDFDPKFIFTDWRLRECNYGDMTQSPKEAVEAARMQYIDQPFPGGESYTQCMQRMASFLNDLKAHFDGKTVMIIGHRATQYGLEHWLNQKPLSEVLQAPWTWQPGWKYQIA